MNRREFLGRTLAGTALAVAGQELPAPSAAQTQALAAEAPRGRAENGVPWYRRTLRWGQTNITEIDPARYDIAWWRQHWRRTRVQGVILNAGGIFAYYPSKFPLHYRPAALGERDLYGELARAAHEDGLVVFARMDSNRTHETFYQAHPDWFAFDAAGKPHRAGELYVTCINSPYYDEYIPAVLREIIERSKPEGITDNSWSGLGRGSMCFCENCRKKFRAFANADLPGARDWSDPVYRQWIVWNYRRRLEVWDLNNRATREAGGPHCLWVGMNSGSITSQCASFRDYRAICERAEIIMLDHQARGDASGFQHNGEAGKLIHGLLGWEKLIPESMAMYQAGRPTFRLASKPEAEARLWMLDGFAGGLQPWWHHVGAYHEDRRMYRTAETILRWHEANEQFLVNRRPVATVGLVWSQTNTDFYGQDDAETLVELPWRGMAQALLRGRIPYVAIHADHIEREAAGLRVLILPNLAAMTDTQVEAVRRFAQAGGGVIATGATSRCNEWGDARPDFALADLLGGGVLESGRPATADRARRRWSAETVHTYLRLTPELRERVYGPRSGTEPRAAGARHAILRGFDETDILPFGGVLEPLRVDPEATVLATFIPPFPIYPPETSWMREPKTDIPAIVVRTTATGARVVFMPADLDRRFARDNLPDHGNLIANMIRWAAKDDLPLFVEGPGLIDCHLYRQPGGRILHLVNLTNAGTWRQPVDELIPVGPLRVRVRVADEVKGRGARLLVSGRRIPAVLKAGWTQFEIKSILDHEVIVLG